MNKHADCKRLLKLEGVGTINAINLYVSLGCGELGTSKQGKDASACIGVTPIQNSSGGKIKLGSIGKHVNNSMLRSQLIAGAMSVVSLKWSKEKLSLKKKLEYNLWLNAKVKNVPQLH